MDTDEHGSMPPPELTHAIIGAGFEVLNEVGHGLHEKPYESALVVEPGLRGRKCDQQSRFPVHYKGVFIHEYIPDLIVAAQIVVDAKVIERITDHKRGRMLNYLRITKLRIGLIMNFKRPKLEWERVAL